VIKLEEIRKSFSTSSADVPVLRGIDLQITKGEFVAITGPSGSGKSTLLAILGCLDRPTGGRYYFNETDVSQLSDDDETRLRSESIGFVFQAFHLIPTLTIVQNLEVPLMYAGIERAKRSALAVDVLGRVGLGHRLSHRPAELSGGEQQRVAVARALIRDPALILADEPTGNLDTRTSASILELLESVREDGNTIVIVTHDPGVAAHADRRIHIVDGLVDSDVATGASDGGA
jgi:putative ABC transport system ATP-binding protein